MGAERISGHHLHGPEQLHAGIDGNGEFTDAVPHREQRLGIGREQKGRGKQGEKKSFHCRIRLVYR